MCLDLHSEDGMGLGCIHLAYVDDAFFKVGISSYLPPGTWGLHSASVSSSYTAVLGLKMAQLGKRDGFFLHC